MEASTVDNLEGKPIAAFNRGVAWSRTGHGRLGHFDSPLEKTGGVYDNEGKRIANFDMGEVHSADEALLGRYEKNEFGHSLYLANSEHVGSCIGSHGSCAAAIVFWSNLT